MTGLRLDGCRLRPLGSYLKALGVLRLVGEQVDPDARAAWHGDAFYLYSSLDADEVVDYFLNRYAPTPLVSPWNGGSGFGSKDQQSGIAAIEASDDPRFAEYRAAIATGRRLVADPSWDDGGRDVKQRQILRCRAELPDAAVAWLDASVVLTADRAVFPPLFGTGGNDGRLEFSNNFMRRLAEVLLEPRRRRGGGDSEGWLRGALFDSDTGPLVDSSVGQYEPSAGEAGATAASGRDTRLANPWDFVLLLEGGLVFASGAARRLGSDGAGSAKAAMPFCVDPTPVGYGSAADGEESRGEVWAPVWRRPATAAEVTRLVGEGRAQWGKGRAASGVDFAKAVATLGVDRGVDRFVRHGLVQRYGLNFLAVPLGEVVVGRRPDVQVLDQVDAWVGRLRRLPAAAASARRRLEAAEYRAAAGDGSLADVLTALAELEAAVSRSSRREEAATRPVWGLAAADWVPRLLQHEDSIELRLAIALTSARDRFGTGTLDIHGRTASSLALLLRPVELDARGRTVWGPGPPRVPGLGRRPLDEVLAAALVRRAIDVANRSDGEEDIDGAIGPRLAFDTGLAVSLTAVAALAEGRVDIARLEQLTRSLLLLDWRPRAGEERLTAPPRPEGQPRRVPPELALLAPFFQAAPVTTPGGEGAPAAVALRPGAEWPALLRAGQVDRVLADALLRLRIAGVSPAVDTVRPGPAVSGSWLAVAALCRLSPGDAARALALTCPPDTPPDSLTSPAEEALL